MASSPSTMAAKGLPPCFANVPSLNGVPFMDRFLALQTDYSQADDSRLGLLKRVSQGTEEF
jgi:hypothetical protein